MRNTALVLILTLAGCALPPGYVPVDKRPLDIGMTPQTVVDTWGMPVTKDQRHSAFLGQSEFWTWGNMAQRWATFEPVDGQWALVSWGRSN